MKAIKVFAVFIFTVFVFNSVNLIAQPRDANYSKKGKGIEQQMPQKAPRIPNLTDEQKEQMKSLKTELMKATKSLKNEIREKSARLHTLSTADEPNMDAIFEVIEDIGELKTGIAKEKEAHRQEIRKLLTEEQRLFFDEHAPKFAGPNKGGLKRHQDRKF